MPARKAKIDLTHRPRLVDLRPLIPATPSLMEARAVKEGWKAVGIHV